MANRQLNPAIATLDSLNAMREMILQLAHAYENQPDANVDPNVMRTLRQEADKLDTSIVTLEESKRLLTTQSLIPIITDLPDYVHANNDDIPQQRTYRMITFTGTESDMYSTCIDFLDKIMSIARVHDLTENAIIELMRQNTAKEAASRLREWVKLGYNLEEIVRNTEINFAGLKYPRQAQEDCSHVKRQKDETLPALTKRIRHLVMMATRTKENKIEAYEELARDTFYSSLTIELKEKLQARDRQREIGGMLHFTFEELVQEAQRIEDENATSVQIAKDRGIDIAEKATFPSTVNTPIVDLNRIGAKLKTTFQPQAKEMVAAIKSYHDTLTKLSEREDESEETEDELESKINYIRRFGYNRPQRFQYPFRKRYNDERYRQEEDERFRPKYNNFRRFQTNNRIEYQRYNPNLRTDMNNRPNFGENRRMNSSNRFERNDRSNNMQQSGQNTFQKQYNPYERYLRVQERDEPDSNSDDNYMSDTEIEEMERDGIQIANGILYIPTKTGYERATPQELNVGLKACIRCGRDGHFAYGRNSQLCPIKGQPIVNKPCTACKVGGHLAQICPNIPKVTTDTKNL